MPAPAMPDGRAGNTCSLTLKAVTLTFLAVRFSA